jgi:hypothetical protein
MKSLDPFFQHDIVHAWAGRSFILCHYHHRKALKELKKKSQNEKRLKLLEIEQKFKESQFQIQLIKNEMQQKMKSLEMQIQEEMMKREEKEKR